MLEWVKTFFPTVLLSSQNKNRNMLAFKKVKIILVSYNSILKTVIVNDTFCSTLPPEEKLEGSAVTTVLPVKS